LKVTAEPAVVASSAVWRLFLSAVGIVLLLGFEGDALAVDGEGFENDVESLAFTVKPANTYLTWDRFAVLLGAGVDVEIRFAAVAHKMILRWYWVKDESKLASW